MPISKLNNGEIKGICCVLPKSSFSIEDLGKYFHKDRIQKVSQIIGIKKLYYTKENETTSDLAYVAAKKLISHLRWEKESIDALLFISQTPDYIIPSTSCILQNKLGLPKDILALDINLGCSGYIYGIWLANQLISNQTCKRAIVLVGDTLSKVISKKDQSVACIFSDGASATAVEYTEKESMNTFALYTDGSGSKSLIIPAGGFRKPYSDETKIMKKDEDGNIRSEENIFMNGLEILGFAVSEVPKSITKVMKEHGWNINNVDAFLLHQANRYILKYIAKKAKIPLDKLPLNIDKFGNTSGVTIPLLICDQLKQRLNKDKMNVIMAGFGVGLSWGAAAMELSNIEYLDIFYE